GFKVRGEVRADAVDPLHLVWKVTKGADTNNLLSGAQGKERLGHRGGERDDTLRLDRRPCLIPARQAAQEKNKSSERKQSSQAACSRGVRRITSRGTPAYASHARPGALRDCPQSGRGA